MVRTGATVGVLPEAVFCKPYLAASASLTPAGAAPAVLTLPGTPGTGTIPGAGTTPGVGKPGVGITPGSAPCGARGLPGRVAAVGVANPFSLNVSTAVLPALTILTVFSLSLISNTW